MTREEEIKRLQQTMDQNWEAQKKLVLMEGISPIHEIIKYLDDRLRVKRFRHFELTAKKPEVVRLYKAFGNHQNYTC